MNKNQQNVQRLDSEDESPKIYPRVLRDLPPIDEKVLQTRQQFIETGKTRGNSPQRGLYVNFLKPIQLNPVQFSWLLGLALGDGSIEWNRDGTTCRLKLQQKETHKELLDVTYEVLKPWCAHPASRSSTRPTIYELTSLSNYNFVPVANLISDPNQLFVPGKAVKKFIPLNIQEYLDPIAVASLYCCDGGRRDYGRNTGMAIDFNLQNFSQEQNERISNALKQRYGLKTTVVPDIHGNKTYYLLRIQAESHGRFLELFESYILPCFQGRLPRRRNQL